MLFVLMWGRGIRDICSGFEGGGVEGTDRAISWFWAAGMVVLMGGAKMGRRGCGISVYFEGVGGVL